VTTPTTARLEPIDRLEDKIKTLVAHIGRLRQEQSRLADDNARLQQELDALRVQLEAGTSAAAEAAALRAERDQVRGRVAEMLEQLDALPL
jgi:regulator of replication initiation timing